MIDSQCCIAQTNTTLLSNCIPINKEIRRERKEAYEKCKIKKKIPLSLIFD